MVTPWSWVTVPFAREYSFPLPFKGALTLLPISLRLAKPGVMGVCLGDLPRLGALDDHCLLPSPRAFSLQGSPKMGGYRPPGCQGPGEEAQGVGWAPCRQYLSSPPARSFCSVELGPQVRPFFLPPTSSSFFGGPLLRPHVPLPPLLLPLLLPPPPSTGVTGPREATWLMGLSLSPLSSQPYSPPPLVPTLHLEAQGSLGSNPSHDPSLLCILPQLPTAVRMTSRLPQFHHPSLLTA